jgi:hypothetical protein
VTLNMMMLLLWQTQWRFRPQLQHAHSVVALDTADSGFQSRCMRLNATNFVFARYRARTGPHKCAMERSRAPAAEMRTASYPHEVPTQTSDINPMLGTKNIVTVEQFAPAWRGLYRHDEET